MRQVLQELGSGRTLVAEVPEPARQPGYVRILTRRSLISAGTERMLVEFGRAGWLERARQQPERVQQVLGKMRTDGVAATLEAVRSKLDESLPLGYCNVGVVAADQEVPGFAPGDRVVSNGPHAEVVSVPINLCARIPANVSDDAAAFTVIGAIGLQGVRLAAPTLGESFVVTGLGLIGLITVQLLHANGCRVLGIDPDPSRTAMARRFGAVTVESGQGADPLSAALEFSGGRGVDGVLITAATQSDAVVSQAAQMCRKRGRIVLVGVAGLNLKRADFYEKELTFQVSCSYGPGRYDPDYEQAGRDYPFGFVRWTEQRNFQALLELMSAQKLDLESLISHRFELTEAVRAYDLLASSGYGSLGVMLQYPEPEPARPVARSVNLAELPAATPSEASVAVIGAGNYAARVLLPALAHNQARLWGIASRSGASAAQLGRKFGFAQATTESEMLIGNPQVNTIVIATRHDSHAAYAVQALRAGKHVFVEKPLAITSVQVEEVENAWQASRHERAPLLMVGFNRRFAPHIVRMKALLKDVAGPKSFIITVNAGSVSDKHWTRNASIGGGRLIGEGCHFIDLLRHLAGVPITSWELASGAAAGVARDAQATVMLGFADGSTGTLHYLGNGHPSFPKERIEAFAGGKILQLDNFRRLRAYGYGAFKSMNLWRQDKGQTECMRAFLRAVREGLGPPIPIAEILEVSRVTVAVGEAAGH
jgi:predicted dehydrogenase/threonine dehydrogenase-like Zn-dependent dehydrogenase